VAGALEEGEYRDKLQHAGFSNVDLEPTRIYRAADARSFLEEAGIDPAQAESLDGRFMSAFVRAVKTAAAPKACCGPSCCS
jgi:arsenite methyltransferase